MAKPGPRSAVLDERANPATRGGANNVRGLEGFLTYSAKVPTRRNLVVFPTKLRKGSFVLSLANPFAAGFRDGSPSASWGIVGNVRRRAPGLTSANAIKGAADALVEADWLIEPQRGGQARRARVAYGINPRVWEAQP